MITTFNKFINENSTANLDILNFLSDKSFLNNKTKQFLFHGTSVSPDKFVLRDDYDDNEGNVWSGDLPSGYLFLSTDINEAKCYGQFVIPCELKRYDNISFSVNTDNPSRSFDMNYGIDLYKSDDEVNFWYEFENSTKISLIIKGNNKSTIITPFGNVIPRTDLAILFYNK